MTFILDDWFALSSSHLFIGFTANNASFCPIRNATSEFILNFGLF